MGHEELHFLCPLHIISSAYQLHICSYFELFKICQPPSTKWYIFFHLNVWGIWFELTFPCLTVRCLDPRIFTSCNDVLGRNIPGPCVPYSSLGVVCWHNSPWIHPDPKWHTLACMVWHVYCHPPFSFTDLPKSSSTYVEIPKDKCPLVVIE